MNKPSYSPKVCWMQYGSGSTCLACAEDAALMGNASGAQDSQACPESHMFINSGRRTQRRICMHFRSCGYLRAMLAPDPVQSRILAVSFYFELLQIASYENIFVWQIVNTSQIGLFREHFQKFYCIIGDRLKGKGNGCDYCTSKLRRSGGVCSFYRSIPSTEG